MHVYDIYIYTLYMYVHTCQVVNHHHDLCNIIMLLSTL